MARGSSSSQVGLFSTQISEQIVRLRALSAGQDGPSEAHQVDLRRAVMATRLLAGSARVLKLEVLQQFLDELLRWLQSMEESKRALNTTQALILESVVELEESLMLHLDEAEREADADLTPFQEQIDELLRLIRHNSDKIDPGETPSAPEPEEDVEDSNSSDPSAFDAVAAWFEEAIEGSDSPEELDEVQSRLDAIGARVDELRDAIEARRRRTEPADAPLLPDDDLDTIAVPEEDPLFGRAVTALRAAAARRDVTIDVRAASDATDLSADLLHAVGEILEALADDVLQAVPAAEPRPVRAIFSLESSGGRAVIRIVDDAPREQGVPMIGDADHLSMLGGLRRARSLVRRIDGLVRVLPTDEDTRFELVVPLSAERVIYRTLHVDGTVVAVPASTLEQVVEAAGLLYETDESGESVVVGDRSVPLIDLTQFVEDIVPGRGQTPRIAIVGSVEKRMGIGCDAMGELLESDDLRPAPAGWGIVAARAIVTEDETIPVLDVRRLIELRFRPQDIYDLSGALADPVVDSFVPTEVDTDDAVDFEPDEEAVDTGIVDQVLGPAPPDAKRSFDTALLVNQSDFRRRDLSRTLEGLGIEVDVSDDLQGAVQRMDEGSVDLLVTDLRLGQAGSSSFHQIRTDHPELTIVLTSSVSQLYAGELAEKTGAHGCWVDPYRKSDLRQLLDGLEH